jgi:hypothetical protein
MSTQNELLEDLRPATTPVGILSSSGVRVRNRSLDELEQDLAMTYHALLLVRKGLSQEDQARVMKARLIGTRNALQVACELAADGRMEDWNKLRARVLQAARYHYNRDGVDAAPQWKSRVKARRIV